MNVDPANLAGRATPQAILDLGARWLRIEWKASHGYGFFDPLIASYQASGVKVLLLVDYSSVPENPPSNASNSAWNDYLVRFASGVSARAAHHGNGVDAWQIWNEPDLFGVGTGYNPEFQPINSA